MVDKVVCKASGCSNLIQETTAARTGGRCMPCVQAAAKKERDEYIRKNRRDFNEFEGVTDVVEALKVIHKPRKYDPLINWIPHPTPTDELYLGLSESEQSRLTEYAKGLVGTERNQEAEEICLCLSAFTSTPLDACLRRLVSYGRILPSLAFRNAPVDVRDELVERVECDACSRGPALLALAWIGDSTVVEHFRKWRSEKPAWGDSLFIPPEDYSREAGWELTPEGNRRDLVFPQCHALESGASNTAEPFRAISERGDHCPWCSSKLTNLFQVELAAFGLPHTDACRDQVEVLTCEVCTAFGTVFSSIDRNGSTVWSPRNVRPEYLPDDSDAWGRLPQGSLRVGKGRSALHSADQFLPTRFSQIGGYPTWVQDSAYPKCLECSQTMMFLAQVDRQDIEQYSEGMFFAFVCLDCLATATVYQQT
ncbi:hypothetical protein KOR34_24690 [Posidoniimonas corsicana]|uniref:DUF1963 domain-containing protein n=1 Tax=Posidoniimonas corsicana TaxID=1938618 RepID=A0A5C5VHQ7_9BACT|nr:DUF1963 domain-containing protein [Posidoniimonas corsicana]TWT37517.1 hypothetical protein KOR34_24690 [Posidoniimonas corsicana]